MSAPEPIRRYVFEVVDEADYFEVLNIFESYGYGPDEMDAWLNSLVDDVQDQFPELEQFV